MPDPAVQPSDAPVIPYKAGEYLFREGERHGSLFVIESGQVELVRALESGSERLALLGAGDVAGEDCAFGRRAAGCSARAVIDSSTVRVSAETLQDLLRLKPEIAAHLIESLGRRLLEARVACAIASAPDTAAPARVLSHEPAAPPPRAARLVHDESGTTFPLPAEGDAVVGRADPRTRFRPEVELSSLDTGRSLSRRHALISRQGARFLLTEDGHAANGTFVNGRRVKPGEAVPLKDGDEVCFGLVRTVFRAT